VEATYCGELIGAVLASALHPGVSYRLDRAIGEGGTAKAFLATREAEGSVTTVVLKVVLPSFAKSQGSTASMIVRKEAVALGRLNEVVPPSAFVVRLYDTGMIRYQTAAGAVELPWVALEYVHGGVEGTSLEERVGYSLQNTGFAFDRERAARAIRHLCDGLSEVHAAGIIHRDLTPGNVLCCGFGKDEVFKLSDFGLARPVGMEATFGAGILGTPGYMPPEQLGVGDVTLQADIFPLGALAYFVLTGERYFRSSSALQALAQAQTPERRSIRECRTVVPELLGDASACAAIDDLLRRATAVDRTHRPPTALAFANELIPVLEGTAMGPKSVASGRLLASMRTLISPAPVASRWTVHHSPGDDRVILALDWDSDGHSMAATTRGLEYWSGSEWITVPAQEMPLPGRIRAIARSGPGRWLLGSDEAALIEYSRRGVSRIVRGPDPHMAFERVSGDIEDLLVVAGRHADATTMLCAHVGGRWLKPLALPIASLLALVRLDDERWLLAGRGGDGRGFVAIYWPLRWETSLLSVVDSRAYVAAASRVEWGAAIAVGANGAVVRIDASGVRTYAVPEATDFSVAGMDVLGRAWAGSAGALFVNVGDDKWLPAWRDPSWTAPFVGVYADVGQVIAMTADGGVIESRLMHSEIHAATMKHMSGGPAAGRGSHRA
jgi:serine/threonine protein kinase